MSGRSTKESTGIRNAYLSAAKSAYERDKRERRADRYGLDRTMIINFRLAALWFCDWNRSLAAHVLGITSRTIRYTITEAKQLGLHVPMPERGVKTSLSDEEHKVLVRWAHHFNMFKICKDLADDNNRKQVNDNQNGQRDGESNTGPANKVRHRD